MTTDLTEKLKELLMKTPVFGNYNEINAAFAAQTAKQLAPEIEKMMPRWIPVSERLPEIGETFDAWIINNGRYPDSILRGSDVMCFGIPFPLSAMSHWMPIMKGPMG